MVMLPPILLAAVCRSAIRRSSWSDCNIVLLSTACSLLHYLRNDWMHWTWYWRSCCLSPTIVAIIMPVSTSIPVTIAVVVGSPSVLQWQKSNCTTGILLFCFGWLSALPLLAAHLGHQLLKGRCVSSCSALSCCVGCAGAVSPLAGFASCGSSSSTSCTSSLYEVLSSKFVEPVHGTFKVACRLVVQSSSIPYHLAPDVGLMIVVLSGISLVTSGLSCVCCGM